MKTQTNNARAMLDMINNSTLYTLFVPGGAYNEYFEEVLRSHEFNDKEDLLSAFIDIASMGYICGKGSEHDEISILSNTED